MRKTLPLLVLAGLVFLAMAKSHHFKDEEEDYGTQTSRPRNPRTHENRRGRGDRNNYEDETNALENPESPHHKKHQKGHHGI